ncbi:TadE/TadG family type IV pilus assembly protein [Thermomonospora curvata]|uniref:TadE family protein n=1 Tax=Thermomonospora curvata (strain ATCC 19995 / DSM 43183 / JCM 3096 / KCTC 9072 / NBRC 15933 / NCIMB 10081 / Henssen B9) TaxID=471852 RepID=D1A211_THECD|nr:TadE family protein [Thermomonospora curvata]ACY99664.1 TadE family protein [Thermomonospora curvata DSM 43183]
MKVLRRALRRAGTDGDRGTIAMYTVLLTPSVLLLAGLLVDGGLAIHARQRAADMAEQAARAGANEIDVQTLRATGEPRIDAAAACASAYDLLDAYGQEVADRDCLPGAEEVRITVTIRVRPQLLAIVPGLGHFTMTSTASAHPETGETP